MSFRHFRRRLQLGLPTLLGLSSKGYFIPYRYAGSDLKAGARPAYAAVHSVMEVARPRFEAHLDALQAYDVALNGFSQAEPPRPRWQQDWFPRLDGAMAYSFVRRFKPARIIEVGSGHSTRFMAQAVADEGLKTEITAIDPAPRADIRKLASVQIINKPVQQVDLSCFEALRAGDILFVDSSHILMPGSDVDLLFNHIMPMLPTGVLVHIHDICLPLDYPKTWDWRGYNEQLAVVPMITGGGYRVEWASHYVSHFMQDAVTESLAGRLPIAEGALETSLWLMKQ